MRGYEGLLAGGGQRIAADRFMHERAEIGSKPVHSLSVKPALFAVDEPLRPRWSWSCIIRARLKKLKTEQRHAPRSLNREAVANRRSQGQIPKLRIDSAANYNQLLWGITKRLML